jgi:hypothetical protein
MQGGLPPESPAAGGSVGEGEVFNTGNITSSISNAGEGDFSFDKTQSGLTYRWPSSVLGRFSIADGGQANDSCIVISSSRVVCIDNTSSQPSVTILQR